MARTPGSKRARQQRFLEALIRTGGRIDAASALVGISRKRHAKWMAADPWYRTRFGHLLAAALGDLSGLPPHLRELLLCAVRRAENGSRKMRHFLLANGNPPKQ